MTEADFASESFQYMIGRTPVKFDFLTSLPSLQFEKCWAERVIDDGEGFPIHYLGKAALLEAKRQAGRMQDLADIEEIQRAEGIS